MRIQATAKAKIQVLSIYKKEVTIQVLMPDGESVVRTLREGENYENIVKVDIEYPTNGYTSFSITP